MPERNPAWSRDEIILALDLYFRYRSTRLLDTHPEVIRLSTILNSLPLHAETMREPTFRNPAGVSMKLSNLSRLDPLYEGVGLRRGGKLEEQVWDEFAQRPDDLKAVAQAIMDALPRKLPPTVGAEDEESFPEGSVLYRQHSFRERNRSLVARRKALALQAGSLKCVACGFDFLERYGEIGRGFIECHHTIPLWSYANEQQTRLSDLALVCSNCHRMLHRRRPWLTMKELTSLIHS